MIPKKGKLQSIRELAEIKRSVEMAKLKNLLDRVDSLERIVERFNRISVESSDKGNVSSAYKISNREIVWSSWREIQLRQLQAQIANAKANVEKQKSSAAVASAKYAVIDRLMKR